MIIAISMSNSGRNTATPTKTLNEAYVKYITSAGFTPILVPTGANPAEISKVADGLLLSGGIDIDPIYYGLSNYASYGTDPERDASERALLYAFKDAGKPIMGICRGMQMIAREYLAENFGDYSNFLEYVENVGSHSQTGNLQLRRDIPSHQVRVNKQSLYSLKQMKHKLEVMPVNSMHHQCLAVNFVKAAISAFPGKTHVNAKELSAEPSTPMIKNFELVAWSMRGISQPKDGIKPDYINYWAVIEAFKIHNWGSNIIGVQWHPEELMDTSIARNFFLTSAVSIATKQEKIAAAHNATGKIKAL